MEQLTLQTLEFEKIKTYLARFTYSALGKTHIDALEPMTEPQMIEICLAEVSEIKDIRALHGPLPIEGLRDLREPLALARVQGAILSPLEFRQIYDTLRAGRAVKKFIEAVDPPVYKQILQRVGDIALVDGVEVGIRQAIDEEGEILDGASQALKRIRRDLRQAREKIQAWLQHFLQRQDYQSVIQDQVITMRQNRYVIPVKASSRGKIKGIVHDQSSSGVTVFLEPLETVELNNYIASLEAEEKREIQRILLELTDLVRQCLEPIQSTLHILGKLDFINAKAKLSEVWHCTQPKLTKKRELHLLQARHPLLLLQYEEVLTRVVPIDVHLSEEYTTLLITGPNTGGKTVSLKTIGLLALMVQAGLHIPAAKDSEVSVFQSIFADIGDQQSIEQNLSTFSAHVSHIVQILKQADRHSLILLDELGAGTDPAEGASLGIAILEYLDQVNALCLATTHHDALKSYAYTHPRTMNACVEFDVNTLSPTYRLMIGLPGKSNAFIIAERLGLSQAIIQRAKDLIGEDLLKVDHLIRKLTIDSEEMSRKKTEIEARYRGVLRLEKETDKLLAMAEQERQQIVNNALGEARQIMDQAIQQSQQVLKLLPGKSREEGKQLLKPLHKEAAVVREKLKKTKLPRIIPTETGPGEVTIGAKVRLAGFSQTGTVLGLSKDEKQAEIQVGSMRVEIPIHQLTPLSQPHVSSAIPAVSVSDHSGAGTHDQSVPLELVVVGKRVDDALEEVEKYLDQAFLSGISSVAVVHGLGTGTLKKAVSDLLRSHPHVVNYAVDEHNYGMTNVELARK